MEIPGGYKGSSIFFAAGSGSSMWIGYIMTYDGGHGSSYTKSRYTSCNQKFFAFLHSMC